MIIASFLFAFLAAAAPTLLSKPVFRSTTRILVEGKPLSDITMPPYDGPVSFKVQCSWDIRDQIKDLQSERVLKRAHYVSHVPPGLATVKMVPIGTTELLDVYVDSTNAKFAEKFANELPQSYVAFVTEKRRREVTENVNELKRNLRVEQKNVLELDRKMQALRELGSRSQVVAGGAARINQHDISALRKQTHAAKAAVELSQRMLNDLELRSDDRHDQVTVIAPEFTATQVSPHRMNIVGTSGLFGIILALGMVLLVEWMDYAVVGESIGQFTHG